MKSTITILLILALISCTRNINEQELIGVWNNYPSDGSEEIRFYNDSVASYYNIFHRNGTWKANSSQLKFYFPSLKNVKGYNAEQTFDYKINGDSLSIKNPEDSFFKIPVFFKVNNYWTHYLRQFDLQIDLPIADFEIRKNDSIKYGIDLFVGFKHKKLTIIKTSGVLYYNNEVDLGNIKSIVYAERAQYAEEKVENLDFNLIVDKNISEHTIDSIKNILNVFPEMKIFRVYKNDTANYGKYDLEKENLYDWSWYGRYE